METKSNLTIRHLIAACLWVGVIFLPGGAASQIMDPIEKVVFACDSIGKLTKPLKWRGVIIREERSIREIDRGCGKIYSKRIVIKSGHILIKRWLSSDLKIYKVMEAAFERIDEGSWVGVVYKIQPDQSNTAIAVWILPNGMAAPNINWDFKPESKLIGGIVSGRRSFDGYDELYVDVFNLPSGKNTIKYKLIHGTPIANVAPSDLRSLEFPSKSFIVSSKNLCDCELEVDSLFVGDNGMSPPM